MHTQRVTVVLPKMDDRDMVTGKVTGTHCCPSRGVTTWQAVQA
jgi:hypothetical protein